MHSAVLVIVNLSVRCVSRTMPTCFDLRSWFFSPYGTPMILVFWRKFVTNFGKDRKQFLWYRPVKNTENIHFRYQYWPNFLLSFSWLIVAIDMSKHRVLCQDSHGRRSSVNFRGHDIFARKICMKNQQNDQILQHSCPKNYQNTRIFMIFAQNSRILHDFCQKNARKILLSRFFFWGGGEGHVPSAPPPGLLRL